MNFSGIIAGLLLYQLVKQMFLCCLQKPLMKERKAKANYYCWCAVAHFVIGSAVSDKKAQIRKT